MEMEALKWVMGIVQVLVSAWCVVLWSEIKSSKKANDENAVALSAHKLHTAETFMTKSESTRAFDTLSRNIESLLSTMNNRFDRMDSKLDSKMDKGE